MKFNLRLCWSVLAIFAVSPAAPALSQMAAPGFGSDTGKRAFVVHELSVPVRMEAKRTVSIGTVVKPITFDGAEVALAYNDVCAFRLTKRDYASLSSDLAGTLNKLSDQSEFTRALASGNSYLNINLSKARTYLERASKLQPSNAEAAYSLALAQSDTAEKKRLLGAVPEKPKFLKLLAETQLAKLDGNVKRLEEIASEESAPVQARAEGALQGCLMALKLDPW